MSRYTSLYLFCTQLTLTLTLTVSLMTADFLLLQWHGQLQL
jgi:hypothetical protein